MESLIETLKNEKDAIAVSLMNIITLCESVDTTPPPPAENLVGTKEEIEKLKKRVAFLEHGNEHLRIALRKAKWTKNNEIEEYKKDAEFLMKRAKSLEVDLAYERMTNDRLSEKLRKKEEPDVYYNTKRIRK